MKHSDIKISEFDIKCYQQIRENISNFMKDCADKYDQEDIHILDVAPQIHEGTKTHFNKSKIATLDIDPNSGATYIADITRHNDFLKDEMFNIVVCTEVLEHTLNPFSAINEIHRILKPSGILLLSVPFNFRIHGPLPDCWRFTEHGLRELLNNFNNVKIESLETPGRSLMPIHYVIAAFK